MLGIARFSFVCGKKNIRIAVVRNRLKRRMREGVRGMISSVIPGVDIVCFFRGRQEVSFREIKECLEALFRQSNLLKKIND